MIIRILEKDGTISFGELEVIDPETGGSWIRSLVGNNDEPDNDDSPLRTMTREFFDWWHRLTTELQVAENRKYRIFDRLRSMFENIDCHIKDLPTHIMMICDDIEEIFL